jgi:hypothetical protein
MKLPRPKMHARTTELVDERAEVEDKDSAQQKEVDQEDGNNKGMLLDEQAGGTLGAGAIGADPETETVVLDAAAMEAEREADIAMEEEVVDVTAQDDTVMQAEQAEEREEADAMMMPAELVDAVALGETFRVLMVRVRNTKERLSMASHK